MRKTFLLIAAAITACVLATFTMSAQGTGGPAPAGPAPGSGPQPGVGAPAGPAGLRAGRAGRIGQPGPGGPGQIGQPKPGGPGARPRLGMGLDLTEDQRVQVRGILLKARDESGQLRDELLLARRTLRRQVFADKTDPAKITELTTKMASLQKQVADIRVKALTSVSGVLTPEQRQKARVAPRMPFGDGPGNSQQER